MRRHLARTAVAWIYPGLCLNACLVRRPGSETHCWRRCCRRNSQRRAAGVHAHGVRQARCPRRLTWCDFDCSDERGVAVFGPLACSDGDSCLVTTFRDAVPKLPNGDLDAVVLDIRVRCPRLAGWDCVRIFVCVAGARSTFCVLLSPHVESKRLLGRGQQQRTCSARSWSAI